MIATPVLDDWDRYAWYNRWAYHIIHLLANHTKKFVVEILKNIETVV